MQSPPATTNPPPRVKFFSLTHSIPPNTIDLTYWCEGAWLLRGIWPQRIEHAGGWHCSPGEKLYDIKKQYNGLISQSNYTKYNKCSRSVSMWVCTTGGARSPVIMLESGLWADMLASISVSWWHRVSENMGCYTGCSEKWHISPLADVPRLTLKGGIPPPNIHTHTHICTHTYSHQSHHALSLPHPLEE